MNEELQAAQKAAAPFSMWWAMFEAQEELAGTPIADDIVIFHFMGSGASTMVTAGQIRAMLDAIFQCKDGKPTPGDNCEIINQGTA